MTIVLPILFVAVCFGLFVRRMTPLAWGIMLFWIVLVILVQYRKH